MLLADKIIMLRRKNGWSQEELAEKLDVTRQSVSKWEGAQSVPDIQKIIQMSRIFGVSTDFLLKDEIEAEETNDSASASDKVADATKPTLRRVSVDDARKFLKLRRCAAPRIATATLMCILSPVCLFILGVASETRMWGITENAAGGIGLAALLLIVAAASVIFVLSGMKSSSYEFLEKEDFERESGVVETVSAEKERFSPLYSRINAIAVFVVILAVIPLIIVPFLTENEFFVILGLCALFLLAGIAVWMFIYAGVIWASFQKLLREGEYESSGESRNRMGALSTAYWLIITAVFLTLSFFTNEWQKIGLIWPVAGVLYGAFCAVWSAFRKDK